MSDETHHEVIPEPGRENLRLATSIVLDHEQKALFIDGIEFPLYMHERGPSVEHIEQKGDAPPLVVVNLPVICETYDVVGEPDE